MAPIDLVCIGFLVLFGLIGLLRGFAKQMMTLLGWFFSLLTAVILVPVLYKLLFTDGGALESFRTSFEGLFASLTIPALDEMAVTYDVSSGGTILARWIIMFGLLLLTWILTAIIFKLVRMIFRPFAYSEGGVKAFDRILGIFLGVVIGAAVFAVVLGILSLLRDTFTGIDDLLTKYLTDESLTVKYLSPIFDKVGEFFKGVFNVYKTTKPE
ncbi:MAG: CvpA family protein [Clostridia bacterium]|nr:CvpA family protein [Clostridia bacterium]MDY2901606.1 CvpA family protein [Christensenellaceae bacterium]